MAKITVEQHTEKAVFVGVIKQGDDERQIMEYLDELEFLAETAGAIGVKKFIQKAMGGSFLTKARVVVCIPSGVPDSDCWYGRFVLQQHPPIRPLGRSDWSPRPHRNAVQTQHR